MSTLDYTMGLTSSCTALKRGTSAGVMLTDEHALVIWLCRRMSRISLVSPAKVTWLPLFKGGSGTSWAGITRSQACSHKSPCLLKSDRA